MADETSVAPKERVNIRFSPATGDVAEDIELPFKQVVVGKFNTEVDETPLEERERVDINKEDASLPVSLSFATLKDFEPEQIVNSVPELRKLLELRKALLALKGPLGNVPAFRKAVQNILDDEDLRNKLLNELGIDPDKEEEDAASE